ncbi:MAG: replication factor C small subunit [Candidatus Diapherotrites archaeon]|nr:replication factor C small subunit [Candidatus Micrarchaeota archaeon]MBU1939268.1 replication factor C small subunit [Candidatus Micrarchaeota archaeon]
MALPWVEKYRPVTLSDVVGQGMISERLQSYVKNRNVPNMMFSGSAGIGKTSSAVALARELYGKNFSQNFLELNASDERGIDVVRNTIKDFARTLAFDANFKIIFLDESDSLTSDAQQALRRTMERYTKTCRFILSCNYSSKIIEPIQSRCVVFRFKPLAAEDIKNRLGEIAKIEGAKLTDKAMDAVVYVADGDCRKAINILEASVSLGGEVDEKIVYSVSSRAEPAEIKELIGLALKKDFLGAREKLDVLLHDYGMSGEDVVLQLYKEVVNAEEERINSRMKIDLIDKIGEYNFRITEGANDRIQLEALIAQFMKYENKGA